MDTNTKQKPARPATEAEARDALADALVEGRITPEEWARRSAQLDRRNRVLTFTLLASVGLGFAVSVAAIIGGAYAFILLVVALVGGTP